MAKDSKNTKIDNIDEYLSKRGWKLTTDPKNYLKIYTKANTVTVVDQLANIPFTTNIDNKQELIASILKNRATTMKLLAFNLSTNTERSNLDDEAEKEIGSFK